MGNASSARRHNIEPPPPAAVVVEQDADGSSLFSLKYASVLSGSEQDTEQGIAGIITSSLKNNTARGITGMLYHDPSTKAVVQVLEGPRDAVQRLYEKIQCDTRHTGCRIISQRLVPARAYADFGMALARTTGDVEQLISEAETPQHSFAEHLVRIQYTSTLLAPNEEQARLLLQGILHSSVRNNSARGIGGLLCFNPATMQVAQLLEGPAGSVQDLFTTIMADARHTDCRLTNQELLMSKSEYIFGASWGLIQSDTQLDVGFVDLSARIRQVFHGKVASAAIKAQPTLTDSVSSAAQMLQIVDDAVAVQVTPVASEIM